MCSKYRELNPQSGGGGGWGALLRSERVWYRFASMLPTELWVSSNLLAGLARGLQSTFSRIFINGISKPLQCWIQGPCRTPNFSPGMPQGGLPSLQVPPLTLFIIDHKLPICLSCLVLGTWFLRWIHSIIHSLNTFNTQHLPCARHRASFGERTAMNTEPSPPGAHWPMRKQT